jgi:hypothetical protein
VGLGTTLGQHEHTLRRNPIPTAFTATRRPGEGGRG